MPLLRRCLAGLLAGGSAAVMAACPPAGESVASLAALKAAARPVPAASGAASAPGTALAPNDAAAPVRLAVPLLDCLAHPDPQLRDDLGFELLQAWMRAGRLDDTTVRALQRRLEAVLRRPADAAGFEQPFAALTLAEVARVDRLRPFLDATGRAELVALAAQYLAGVHDRRGFDPREGWRHGVAHGADLVLQLSLNPALQPAQSAALLEAVAVQVVPAGEHAYRDGEPLRLMAPVYQLARRGGWGADEWRAWFERLVARRPPAQPTTVAALAAQHNLMTFLTALYTQVQEGSDAGVRERLLPGLRAALRATR